MFGRAVPLKNTGGSGGVASSGGGGGGRPKGSWGAGGGGDATRGDSATYKGKRFEKRVEYQNPEAFAGVEVRKVHSMHGTVYLLC